MELTGLHHVSAVTRQAPQNVAFYTRTLGMRLVKKTVNQDDVSSYHLFYADSAGHAGTELTFFDWPPYGAPNRDGAGAISTTALRVSGDDALAWWKAHFTETRVAHGEIAEVAGRNALPFRDPEGQSLILVSDGGVPGGTPWTKSPVPAEVAIKGLDGVTLTVRRLSSTERVLVDVLGFRRTREYEAGGHPVIVFETGPGGPGTEVHVAERSDLQYTRLGAGGVHHVAFRTPNSDEQLEWERRLHASGIAVSAQIDRFYFKSLYFREPNGILFEIATDGPGFATDEDPDHLGEALALPPFLEPRRAEIEAGLKPLETASVA